MIRLRTDKELRDELSKLTIVCDTREQRNEHIVSYLESKNIPNVQRKLDIGDYSAQIDSLSLERDVVIERKHGLDEICGNLTADRDRFEREFLRAKACGTKVFLVIEDASWADIYAGNYRSKISAKSLVASLMSWQVRFNITIIFAPHHTVPRMIHEILYYAAREALLNG